MADNLEPENPYEWMDLLTNSAGFVWGFLLGGATGYFGNWLWDKFRPKKRNGHLLVETDSEGTSFSGRITKDNKDQVLKTLRATATPTGRSTTYGSSKTGSGGSTGRGSTKEI